MLKRKNSPLWVRFSGQLGLNQRPLDYESCSNQLSYGPSFEKDVQTIKIVNNLQLCKMKNLKAIIFDLGAVILNINYKNTINEFKKLGVKNPESFILKKHKLIYLIN